MTQEFKDISSLMAHLLVAGIIVQKEAERGLGKAARVISEEAKSELGFYQPQVGEFVAWAPLSERTLKYHADMGVGESPELVTGELYASIEDEQHGTEAVSGSKLQTAEYQELGTEKMPPRPIFGPAAVKSKGKIEKIMGASVMKGMLYGAAGSWTSID